jgi:hypothetical protein
MISPTYAARNLSNPGLETDYYDSQNGSIIEQHIGGSVSWRNNNPGNILYGSFAISEGAIGQYTNGNFSYAIFSSQQAGASAVIDLLTGSGYEGSGLSINSAIAKYTAASGVDLTNYQSIVINKVGTSGSTLLSNLTSSQFALMEQGIQQAEGYSVGTDTISSPATTASSVSNGFRHPLGNGTLTQARGDPDGFYVAQDFNVLNAQIGAGGSFHLGEDWNGDGGGNTDLGDPVYAISNGQVVQVGLSTDPGTGPALGNYVVIRHDLPNPITVNGVTTSQVVSLYAHLEFAPTVAVGNIVRSGQQIGQLGATGDAAGAAHLHFEIRLGTQYHDADGYNPVGAPSGWVDPTDFINAHRTILTGSSPSATSFLSQFDATIKLIFNGIVHAASGLFDIFKSDGSLLQSVSALDTTHVQFVDNTVTVHPTVQLLSGSDYYLTVASGSIVDVLGNSFAGISSNSPLTFSTVPKANTNSIFLSITDNSITEGADGTKTLSFGVNLTGAGAGTQTVSVQYATQDIAGAGSPAVAGQDYIATSSVLVIPAGQTFGQIDVKIFGDSFLEPDEVFRLVLTQPSSNLTLLNSSGQVSSSIFATGFIDNDDQAPDHNPRTVNDIAITAPATSVQMDVLSNDSDVDGDALHVSQLFSVALGGTTAIAGNGTFSLSGNGVSVTPNPGAIGIFSYNYVVDDGRGGLANGYASVIVSGDGSPGITNIGTVGDDIIIGAGGNDTLSGGFGDDIIYGGPGSDRIDGGPGFNYLDLRQAAHAANFRFQDPWTSDDGDGGHDILTNIEGVLATRYDDQIDGSSGSIQYISTGYRFYGGDGNDRLRSDAGDDILDGGPGNDNLIYGAGRDLVFGGPGSDQIYGFNNQGDAVSDTLHGGAGDDFIYATDGVSADLVFGEEGNDYLQFSNGDIVSGGPGADTFFLAGFNSATPYHATITDLEAGDTIKWQFHDPVIINNTAHWFIGPIAGGNGTATALDHVEFASANGQTTLYFGFDTNPGADFVLSLNGTFDINQFQVDDSDFTLAMHVSAKHSIPHDFNANHHSDILWHNDNGADSIWDNGQIGGAHIIAAAGVVPASWHIAGKGDFDADGLSDILWRNDNGAASIWDTGAIGNARIIASVGVVPNSWHISGTGDFDGNGHDDILWRNDNGAVSIWDNGRIDYAHIISNAGVVPNSWHIAGTGDFDGNGHDDILWRNDNGAASIWDNGAIGSAHIIAAAGIIPSGWNIAGTGDFDGNGHDDVLWRNDNGAVSIWDDGQIGGAHIVSAAGVVPNSWHISDTGDFDGNGHGDIVWRNDNGAASIWDNGAIGGAHIIANAGVIPGGWHIV